MYEFLPNFTEFYVNFCEKTGVCMKFSKNTEKFIRRDKMNCLSGGAETRRVGEAQRKCQNLPLNKNSALTFFIIAFQKILTRWYTEVFCVFWVEGCLHPYI